MGGAEERRRELAEEEMEQAGQPQKLEEEFDVAHNEVEEEEPQANQPDENTVEREQHHAHEVRTTVAKSTYTRLGASFFVKLRETIPGRGLQFLWLI